MNGYLNHYGGNTMCTKIILQATNRDNTTPTNRRLNNPHIGRNNFQRYTTCTHIFLTNNTKPASFWEWHGQIFISFSYCDELISLYANYDEPLIMDNLHNGHDANCDYAVTTFFCVGGNTLLRRKNQLRCPSMQKQNLLVFSPM